MRITSSKMLTAGLLDTIIPSNLMSVIFKKVAQHGDQVIGRKNHPTFP